MANGRMKIIYELARLRDLTSSDFIALAPFIDKQTRMRWKYVIGNSNDRYQQMVIKMGQGLAGSALRLGKWVKLDDTNPRVVQERLECPVMLAEQLQTAAVFPLTNRQHAVMKGLLFIGRRTELRYEEDAISAAQESLERLIALLEEPVEEASK